MVLIGLLGAALLVAGCGGSSPVKQGPPEKIFTAPEHPRTRRFLGRIIEAGRL